MKVKLYLIGKMIIGKILKINYIRKVLICFEILLVLKLWFLKKIRILLILINWFFRYKKSRKLFNLLIYEIDKYWKKLKNYIFFLIIFEIKIWNMIL